MPEEIAMAFAVLLAGARRLAESMVVVCCFCGLLRVGEALALSRDSFAFGAGQLVILLRETKTRSHQRVAIENPQVALFISELLTRVEGHRAVPTSYTTFRRLFLLGLEALGCEHHSFSSHSMRRGGATTLFHRGVHLSDVMMRGRWSSESSCRLYVRTGEAALIAIDRERSASSDMVKLLAAMGPRVFVVPCI